MAIQNITGGDAVPKSVLEESKVYTKKAISLEENNNNKQQDYKQFVKENIVEEGKGLNVDTYG